jgi:hypothetical protein
MSRGHYLTQMLSIGCAAIAGWIHRSAKSKPPEDLASPMLRSLRLDPEQTERRGWVRVGGLIAIAAPIHSSKHSPTKNRLVTAWINKSSLRFGECWGDEDWGGVKRTSEMKGEEKFLSAQADPFHRSEMGRRGVGLFRSK